MRRRPHHVRGFFGAALVAVVLAWSGRAAAVPVGGACRSDKECAVGSICAQKICTAISRTRNVIPFYFHQPGSTGYRYIIPILWFSSWDSGSETQVQFPFFVRHKNLGNQRTSI